MHDGTTDPPTTATFGDLTLDLAARRVLLAGEPVALTKTEFQLLETLARHPGRAMSDRDLLTALWGKPWLGDTAPLQVHVSRLRRKLGESGSRPRFLRTVHGFGYRFDPDPSPAPDLALPTADLAELDASAERAGGVAYLLLDSDRTVQWVSDSITALLGWRPDDLVGVDVRDLADPDEYASWEATRGGLDLGQPLSVSRSIRAADGSFPLIDVSVRPVLGPDDRVSGFLAEWRPTGEPATSPTLAPIAPISLDARTDASLLGLLAEGSDVLFVFDPDGVCTWVSPSLREQFGFEPEQLIGTRTSLVHPDDREAAVRLLRQAMRDHANQVRGRARMVAADGEVRWWDWAITLQYQGGRLVRQLAAVRDVDAEVRAEQALVASQEQFRLMTENAADLVIRFDADLTATWVSASAHRLLGYEPAALLGPARMDLLHPDDRAKVRSGVATLRSGRRLSVNDEIRLRRRDGTHAWWQATARRTGDDPATADIVLALRDIDAEVRARTAVDSERERRAAVVQSMLDPHLLLRAVHDRDGTVIDFTVDDANDAACTAFGQPFDRLVGHRVGAYATGLASSGMVPALSAVIATGHPLAVDDLAYESVTGTAVWVDARAVRVGTDSVSITWRDVTDRHRAATTLAASEARFRAMFTDHAAVMLLLDADTGALIDANTAACRFYGYDHDTLAGMLITDINMLSADQVAQLRRGATDRTGGIFVAPHRLADGTIRTVEVHSSPIDAGGHRLLFSVIHDVTDAHASQTALAAERVRLAAVLDSEIEPHVFLEAVRDSAGAIVDFTYRDVNAAACAYLGLERESLEGARLLDLLPGQAGSGMLGLYADAVESGQPLVLDDYAYPNEILASDRRYDIRAVRVGDGLSFAWRDVTDRHDAAQRLSDSEQRYRMLADNSGDIVVSADPSGTLTYVSPAVTSVLGWAPEDLLGTVIQDLMHPEDVPAAAAAHDAIRSSVGQAGLVRARLRRSDGAYRWMAGLGREILDDSGTVVGRVATWRDVTTEVAAEQTLQRQARTDALTGLLNRAEILARLDAVLVHQPRTGRRQAVLYCDLDGLKQVNDTHGHTAGDLLLATTAARIAAAVRSDDLVARVGGDETLVVLSGVRTLDDALTVAETIRLAVAEPIPAPDGSSIRSTISIGVTLTRPDDTVDTLIARADTAMYAAKRKGGDAADVEPAPRNLTDPLDM